MTTSFTPFGGASAAKTKTEAAPFGVAPFAGIDRVMSLPAIKASNLEHDAKWNSWHPAPRAGVMSHFNSLATDGSSPGTTSVPPFGTVINQNDGFTFNTPPRIVTGLQKWFRTKGVNGRLIEFLKQPARWTLENEQVGDPAASPTPNFTRASPFDLLGVLLTAANHDPLIIDITGYDAGDNLIASATITLRLPYPVFLTTADYLSDFQGVTKIQFQKNPASAETLSPYADVGVGPEIYLYIGPILYKEN